MIRRISALAALSSLSALFFPLPSLGQPDDRLLLLPPPYMIEDWRHAATIMTPEEGGPFLTIDFGAQRPETSDHGTVTVLSATASAQGVLSETIKTCRFMCGDDDGETCHYSGLYSLDKKPEQLGEIFMALPGSVGIENLKPASPQTASLPPPGEESPLAWDPPGSPMEITTYKIKQSGNGNMSLQADTGGIEDPYSIDGKNCTASRHDTLTSVTCDGFAAVFDGSTPLLLSWPDYNTAKAEFMAGFDSGGRHYTVVRLGLKAQDVIGLLVKGPKGWVFLARPRDYALMC